MKFRKIISALSIMAIVFVFAGCSSAINLSLNVKKGDKYNVHEVANQQMTMTINNQATNTNQVMDMNLAMDVQDVDKDKNVTIAYKYDSIKISTESAGQKIEYDSKKPDTTSPLNSIYGAIVGKGFTVKVSNKGQVLEVKGVDDLLNSIVSKLPANDEQKKAFKSTLAQSFGDDAIKSMINQSMNYYPQNSVKTNDTWENKYSIKAMFPMEVSNKLKLLGEKDGLLNVDVQSTINADTKDKPADFMGFQTNVKLKGDCKGTVNINKETGLMEKGNLTETMTGEMELLANKTIPQNIKMPMKMTAKITYETTKK